MSTSTVLARTINQAAPNPTGSCNACERTGFPILPLRAAYAPEPGATRKRRTSPDDDRESVPMRLDQPRTLRMGYLYVLLDNKEWQAYQVTPEGALRQFRPFQPPREEPGPLSQWCIDKNHDVAASFINIDTEKYSTAWIAIANDPWPETVLNQYLRGTADDGTPLETRFYKLDLKSARADPASVGIAMTEDHLEMHQVLEYAEVNSGDFNSVHGFYTRNHRLGALKGHVRRLVQREQLQNGVLALVLPDPIGLVQECNAQRVNLFRAMQEWRSEPQRRFEFFTSQALLGIKELQAAWAAADAAEEAKAEDAFRRRHNNSPMGVKVTFPPLDIKADTQRRTKSKQADARKRLEARYDETQRANFEKAYLVQQTSWQAAIDRVAQLYAREYQTSSFQLAAKYDYCATSWRSVECFIRMLALCLYGGPTDVIENDKEKLGTTQQLWKSQLDNRTSLLYQALLSKDRTLLVQLQSALAGDDLGKVYDTIKSVIGTDEGKNLMVSPVKDAIGQILAATANASNALGQQLSTQAQALVGHVHSAALLRYAGQHVTQVVVSLKLGEYLSLLNEALQERTDEFIAQLDQKFRKPAERKIRAMVLSGAIAIAVSSNHGKMVDVMIWSLESAEALQARLEKLRATASGGVAEAIRTVSIGAATLQSGAVQMVHNLAIGADNARALARSAMQRMRNAAISAAPAGADLLLGLGSLWFQQDSLRKNYTTLVNTPGSGSPEALAAVWSSSIGVMGVGVEIVGIGTRILRPGLTTTVQAAGQVETILVGARIAQYGGAIAAIAGVLDGVQYAFAADRTAKQGDAAAAKGYTTASAIAVISGGIGVGAALATQTILLGPLGIALVLGLTAWAIASWARKSESSPLELWARHSLWGLPAKHRLWRGEPDFDSAVGALNAAVLGVTAELAVETRFDWYGDTVDASQGFVVWDGNSVPVANYIVYRVSLPGYDISASRYQWTLIAYRPGEVNGQVLASGQSDGVPAITLPPTDLKKVDYYPKTTVPKIDLDTNSKMLIINGAIALHMINSINAISLEVYFWPDKNDNLGCARLMIREDKMSSMESM